MAKPVLPVMFRMDRAKGGEVFAVFPTLPATIDGSQVTVYAHVGQHSGGTWEGVLHNTRPATPEEYAPLLRELKGAYGTSHGPEDRPVDLEVYQRVTVAHRRAFRDEVERIRTAAKRLRATVNTRGLEGPTE